MNKSILVIAITVTLGIGVLGGWWLGSKNYERAAEHVISATLSNPDVERKVLYWYDPMKPDAHFEQPGKSPFMDMDLVPRYADEDGSLEAGVRIDPSLLQNTGVKYAFVTEVVPQRVIMTSGNLIFNERDVAILQARTNGIVEKVYDLAEGDFIKAGDAIADIRVPDWFSAQSEYLILRNNNALASAAKSRLLQLGMSHEQIKLLSQTGKPLEVVTIQSPRSGMVAELGIRQGMMVSSGQTLTRINGLNTIWIQADVPESQIATLDVGDTARIDLSAWPNEVIEGKVTSIVPELNAETRTLRVRVEIDNAELRFRPGMFAQIELQSVLIQQPVLHVPSEAVITTGKRSVVIVAGANNRYVPAEVKIGQENNGQTEILSGLHKGEKIVISGQFMIDSEANLRGVLTRLNPDHSTFEDGEIALHTGFGIVKEIFDDEITLDHEPIPDLQWPSMVMPFALATNGIANELKVGDYVRFEMEQKGDGPVIHLLVKVKRE